VQVVWKRPGVTHGKLGTRLNRQFSQDTLYGDHIEYLLPVVELVYNPRL
jgi:hypothetical protein